MSFTQVSIICSIVLNCTNIFQKKATRTNSTSSTTYNRRKAFYNRKMSFVNEDSMESEAISLPDFNLSLTPSPLSKNSSEPKIFDAFITKSVEEICVKRKVHISRKSKRSISFEKHIKLQKHSRLVNADSINSDNELKRKIETQSHKTQRRERLETHL